jgi:hypothetical protein
MDCGKIFGGKRKKRDVDKDEINQISCGTTIKVIDLSKEIIKEHGNIIFHYRFPQKIKQKNLRSPLLILLFVEFCLFL